MKRTTLLIAFIGMITLQSCTINEEQDNVDYDTISEVFEYSNVDLTSGNGYSALLDFPHTIYSSDMVLVYRLFDVINGADVWRSLPQTVYLNQGELDYNFDFTRSDINIFLDSNFDLNTLSSSWAQNQVFRIVIIPGYLTNKNSKTIDFNNYNAVVKAFNIDSKHIKKLK